MVDDFGLVANTGCFPAFLQAGIKLPAILSAAIGNPVMPYKKEEDDDLFEDDFDFVDDEDEDEDEYEDEDDEEEEDSELEQKKKPAAKPKRGAKPASSAKEKAPAAPKGRAKPAPKGRGKVAEKPAPAPRTERVEDEEPEVEEVVAEPEAPPEPVGPPTDHVVHIYEFRKFKRTIDREFTSDDADKFAVEYNRTSANHSRWAVSGNKDDKPTPKI